MVERRVFISSSELSPDDPREAFRAGLLRKIGAAGYSPQEFGASGSPPGVSWSVRGVSRLMERCVGSIEARLAAFVAHAL